MNRVYSENSIAKICKRLKQMWELHNVGSNILYQVVKVSINNVHGEYFEISGMIKM